MHRALFELALVAVCGCGPGDRESGSDGDADTDADTDTDLPDTGPFDADGDGVFAAEDCDDGDAAVGAPGDVWPDGDSDGHGDQAGAATTGCSGAGFAAVADDCDDLDPEVFPGHEEIWCNATDDDCDGHSDDQGARYDAIVYPVLQDAFDTAPDGATVEICASVSGTANVYHPLVLVSGGTWWDGSEARPAQLVGLTIDVPSGLVEVHDISFLDRGAGQVTAADGLMEAGSVWIGGGADVLLQGVDFYSDVPTPPLDRGGAITSRTTGTLTLDDVTIAIQQVPVATDGGAIYTTSDVVLEGGTTITGSSAGGDGGAIWASGTLDVQDALISGNTAGGSGGGIYFAGPLATVSGLQLTGNTALDGGGVALSGAGTWTGGDVEDNVATDSGGGLYLSGDWSLAGTTFAKNDAQGVGGGGAFVAAGASAVFDSTLFDSNDATNGDGGGVRTLLATSLTLRDTDLLTNTSGAGGCAASIEDTPTADLTRVDLDQLGSGCGVGMNVSGSAVTLTDGSVSNCTSYGVFLETLFGGPGTVTSEGTTWVSNLTADVYDRGLGAPDEDYFWTGADFVCDETACTEL